MSTVPRLRKTSLKGYSLHFLQEIINLLNKIHQNKKRYTYAYSILKVSQKSDI